MQQAESKISEQCNQITATHFLEDLSASGPFLKYTESNTLDSSGKMTNVTRLQVYLTVFIYCLIALTH